MKRLVLVCATMSLSACSPDYKSGTTKCDANLGCPSGYVCGASGASGAPDVCYAVVEMGGCGASNRYWCPDSKSCWPSKVACETVAFCSENHFKACSNETLIPSCDPSIKCRSVNYFSCNSQTTDDSCSTCIRQACCLELSNCKNQPDCLSLFACLDGCSSDDGNCIDTCSQHYQTSAATYNAFVSCTNEQCSTDCN
jgi:hypothetical protein